MFPDSDWAQNMLLSAVSTRELQLSMGVTFIFKLLRRKEAWLPGYEVMPQPNVLTLSPATGALSAILMNLTVSELLTGSLRCSRHKS